MEIALLYWVTSIVCWLFALAFGGPAARWAFLLFIIMTLGTTFGTWRDTFADGIPSSWQSFNAIVFCADAVYFFGLWATAIKFKYYWTIWSAGFAFLAFIAHLGPLIDPIYAPKIYRGLSSIWQIPIMCSMVIGIAKDVRNERQQK